MIVFVTEFCKYFLSLNPGIAFTCVRITAGIERIFVFGSRWPSV